MVTRAPNLNGLMAQPQPFLTNTDVYGRKAAAPTNPLSQYGLMAPVVTPFGGQPPAQPTTINKPATTTDNPNSSDKKSDPTRSNTDNVSGESHTADQPSYGEMSFGDKAAFGKDMDNIGSFGRGVIGAAVSAVGSMFGAPLGIDRAVSLATGQPTFGGAMKASVNNDINSAMALSQAVDLVDNENAVAGGPTAGVSAPTNDFGATATQQQAHADAVGRGQAPQGSQANSAGGYSTSGEFGFSTNADGDVVGNDKDKNGVGDGSEGGEGCVINTELLRQDIISKKDFVAYIRYCKKFYHNSFYGERLRRGYQTWGRFFVKKLRKDKTSPASKFAIWLSKTYLRYVKSKLNGRKADLTAKTVKTMFHGISFCIGIFCKPDLQKFYDELNFSVAMN